MSFAGLDVIGEGIVCAVPGLPEDVAAAVLDGTPHVERHPVFVGADGMGALGGWVDGCRDEVDTGLRMGYLLRRALGAALGPDPVARARDLGDLPVIFALPSWSARSGPVRAGLWAQLEAIVAALGQPRWMAAQTDHTGVFVALREAARIIAAGEAKGAIVVGLDSLCAPVIADLLAVQGRMRLAGAPYAAIPGEGAAALIVTRDRLLPDPALSRIEALDIAMEPERLDDPDRGILGRGLGTCLRAVLDGLPAHQPPDLVFADVTGERYRSEEIGGAMLQLDAPPDSFFDMVCPAEALGDMGAAYGALAVAVARLGLAGPGARAVVMASARAGSRAALRLVRLR